MATVTTFITGTSAAQHIENKLIRAKNTINFATTNASAADVVQCLKIPAGAVVLTAYCIITTAEGGTATATFGDGDGADSWDASVNLNATAGTATFPIVGTDAYASGKYYASADTLDLTLGHNMDAAVVDVYAVYSIA